MSFEEKELAGRGFSVKRMLKQGKYVTSTLGEIPGRGQGADDVDG